MKRILSALSIFALLLSMGTMMVFPAAAETTGLVNLYDITDTTNCWIKPENGAENASASFKTSGYIAVQAGSTLYMGPCNASQDYQFMVYSSNSAGGSLPALSGAEATAVR